MSLARPARRSLSPLLALCALACAAPPQRAETEVPKVRAPVPEPKVQAAPPAPLPPALAPPPFRLAFGSCNDTRLPQTLWPAILAAEPHVWLWLGDNIYADTEDMAVMRKMYEGQRAEPGYAALRARVPVIGTWDDHDFGRNNAGREYPKRAEAQQLLLDFLDEPLDSPRRQQEGVYASYDFGAPPYQVRVIVLDTRYHREPPGERADVLGAEQWAWLEARLRGGTAAVNLIASSIQVLAEDHGYEKWANFPAARARLFALIAHTGARNVVFLSGDRHFAELSAAAIVPGAPPLHDLTSSSLNRPWRDARDVNRHRVGELYAGPNFGLVEVDWRAQPPAIALSIRDEQGRAHIEARLPIAP